MDHYNCEYVFMARNSTRKASWTVRQCEHVLSSYSVKRLPTNHPCVYSCSEMRSVKFSGTRDQCVTARREISHSLRVISSGSMYMEFYSTKR